MGCKVCSLQHSPAESGVYGAEEWESHLFQALCLSALSVCLRSAQGSIYIGSSIPKKKSGRDMHLKGYWSERFAKGKCFVVQL